MKENHPVRSSWQRWAQDADLYGISNRVIISPFDLSGSLLALILEKDLTIITSEADSYRGYVTGVWAASLLFR